MAQGSVVVRVLGLSEGLKAFWLPPQFERDGSTSNQKAINNLYCPAIIQIVDCFLIVF
jgi:hypothetical protein